MSEPKRPSAERQMREPDPNLRERVHARMRKMAQLTLLAATPLTNAGCDLASPPTCPVPSPTCERDPAVWAGSMHGQATWGSDSGERIVLLTLSSSPDKPWLQASRSYTIEGGALLPSTAAEPNLLRIKPDAGETAIRLTGTVTCHNTTAPMVIVILPGSGNGDPTVTIDVE
jgi:hypothetical protein